ncbi:MAG TPA: hypothetical protein PLF63_04685 [Rubrivivax sp.]|jgi:hypothetical protein|nr:hypothetical protein [Rubrivivax sp.]
MLDGFKRLFSGSGGPAPALAEIEAWASGRRCVFKAVPSDDGFVVDGRSGTVGWRLEWGPSQRPYIHGGELRLRAELGLAKELQVLLMNQQLQESLEKAMFEQFVEEVQTRLDNETPPEMRWLVMLHKLPGQDLGKLRDRFVALGNAKPWVQHWLEGALSLSLGSMRVEPDVPFVVMISRGRLTLRRALDDPDPRELEQMVRVFDTAIREAARVTGQGVSTESPPPPDLAID